MLAKCTATWYNGEQQGETQRNKWNRQVILPELSAFSWQEAALGDIIPRFAQVVKRFARLAFQDHTKEETEVAKEYYRPQEVAVMLDVSKTTVWRWIREGKLEAVAFSGNLYRIPQKALEQFVAQKRA